MTFLYDCLRRVIGVERGSPNPLEDESNGAEVYDATASSDTFYMSTPYGAPAPGQFGGPPVYRAPTTTAKNKPTVPLATSVSARTKTRPNGSQPTDARSQAGYPPLPWRPGEGPRPQWDSLPLRPPIDDSSQRSPARRSPLVLDCPTLPGYEEMSTTGEPTPVPPPPSSTQGTPPTVHFNR
ncbi:hypothetical protein LSAT2_024581 [Lamellibrachia satsuma]|nr:hypothetical protein LSAT2_024581 [Lamellibrachia satsuma]